MVSFYYGKTDWQVDKGISDKLRHVVAVFRLLCIYGMISLCSNWTLLAWHGQQAFPRINACIGLIAGQVNGTGLHGGLWRDRQMDRQRDG